MSRRVLPFPALCAQNRPFKTGWNHSEPLWEQLDRGHLRKGDLWKSFAEVRAISLEENTSNPAVARAAISRNFQISEGLIRMRSAAVKVFRFPNRPAELLEAVALAEFPADLHRAARSAGSVEVIAFNFHFAVLVSPPVVFGPDSE